MSELFQIFWKIANLSKIQQKMFFSMQSILSFQQSKQKQIKVICHYTHIIKTRTNMVHSGECIGTCILKYQKTDNLHTHANLMFINNSIKIMRNYINKGSQHLGKDYFAYILKKDLPLARLKLPRPTKAEKESFPEKILLKVIKVH